jgi:hypothetical protein
LKTYCVKPVFYIVQTQNRLWAQIILIVDNQLLTYPNKRQRSYRYRETDRKCSHFFQNKQKKSPPRKPKIGVASFFRIMSGWPVGHPGKRTAAKSATDPLYANYFGETN